MRKSSTPSRPRADGLRLPTVAVTCGRAGRLARQVAGMRTTTPAVSSSGRLWRKRDASAGPQRSGWKISPGVDHRPQPVAVFRGALHRQQQGQQFVAVRRPGVFAQRLTERDVLGRGLGGQARRVGRHEGEGLFGVAAVFRQVEMHAADQVPRRVQRVQEALQAGSGGGEGCGEGQRQFIPQRQQDGLGQVFRPGHHRRGQHQGGELAGIERRHDRERASVVLAARGVAGRPRPRSGWRTAATRRRPAARCARPRRAPSRTRP